VTSFERSNLELAVRQRGSADVATNLGELIGARRAGGPAEPTIVYTITRGDAEKVAQVLEARARARAARLWLAAARRARRMSVPSQSLSALRGGVRAGVRRRTASLGGSGTTTPPRPTRRAPASGAFCWHVSPWLSAGANSKAGWGRGRAQAGVHERFLRDELDVVVATVAFGMGTPHSPACTPACSPPWSALAAAPRPARGLPCGMVKACMQCAERAQAAFGEAQEDGRSVAL